MDQVRRRWIKRMPAAIALGVETRVWEVSDMVAQTNLFVAQRRERVKQAKRDAQAALQAIFDEARRRKAAAIVAPYWVYRSHVHHSSKVHAASCVNCQDGQGKGGGGATKSGEWLPFETFEDAEDAAVMRHPERNSICSMCLGNYRSMGYRKMR